MTRAQSLLKVYVREMRNSFAKKQQQISSQSVPNNVLDVAIRICEKRVRDLDDMIDDPDAWEPVVSDLEWSVLTAPVSQKNRMKTEQVPVEKIEIVEQETLTAQPEHKSPDRKIFDEEETKTSDNSPEKERFTEQDDDETLGQNPPDEEEEDE